jgi:hypothetical protein
MVRQNESVGGVASRNETRCRGKVFSVFEDDFEILFREFLTGHKSILKSDRQKDSNVHTSEAACVFFVSKR